MKNRKHLIGDKKKIYDIFGLEIGKNPILIAGPCSVEDREQIIDTAVELNKYKVDILRGGVFKPRTNPYDFQGLGLKGLEYLKEASEIIGKPIITELMDEIHIPVFNELVDIIQIGSRNMYNYSLLKSVGKLNKPVLLKRGMSATIKEWVLAAEYLADSGCEKIILCERGIRTFDNYTRNTLDLAAVPIMKAETGLPIIVDPSHGTGMPSLIEPMSKAALACGADGLMIEVHIAPENALSDKDQTITPEEYGRIISNLNI